MENEKDLEDGKWYMLEDKDVPKHMKEYVDLLMKAYELGGLPEKDSYSIEELQKFINKHDYN